MTMPIKYYANTNQGRVRDNNEDTFCAKRIWSDKYLLLVVVDGCGGYEGGEVASELAKNVIVDYLSAPSSTIWLEQLKQAVITANNKVVDMRNSEMQLANMGCVLTAAIVDEDNGLLFIAHVGDTRCYVFDGKILKKVTRDHSLVGELEDAGYLTEHEAMNHPSRAVIDRMVGDEYHNIGDSFVDATIISLPTSYQILLCSDGLTDYVSSVEIKSILAHNFTIEEKVKCLIDLANSKGGYDNITVVLASK